MLSIFVEEGDLSGLHKGRELQSSHSAFLRYMRFKAALEITHALVKESNLDESSVVHQVLIGHNEYDHGLGCAGRFNMCWLYSNTER